MATSISNLQADSSASSTYVPTRLSAFGRAILKLIPLFVSTVTLSLASPRKVIKLWRELLSRRFSKSSSSVLSYETISLKTFIEISETGNLSLLGGKGRENVEAWEKILAANAKAAGSFEFGNFKKDLRQLALLKADYQLVKAALTKLNFVVDEDTIAFLKKKGYKIDASGAASYRRSILAATSASDNLLSRISLKTNDIERRQQEITSPPSFQQILASLSVALGFTVDENVKLAWFNEAKKLLKQKANGR